MSTPEDSPANQMATLREMVSAPTTGQGIVCAPTTDQSIESAPTTDQSIESVPTIGTIGQSIGNNASRKLVLAA